MTFWLYSHLPKWMRRLLKTRVYRKLYGGTLSSPRWVKTSSHKDLRIALVATDVPHMSAVRAEEALELQRADAVVVTPYLGKDSIEPFLKYGVPVYIMLPFKHMGFPEVSDAVRKMAKELGCGLAHWHAGEFSLEEPNAILHP